MARASIAAGVGDATLGCIAAGFTAASRGGAGILSSLRTLPPAHPGDNCGAKAGLSGGMVVAGSSGSNALIFRCVSATLRASDMDAITPYVMPTMTNAAMQHEAVLLAHEASMKHRTLIGRNELEK